MQSAGALHGYHRFYVGHSDRFIRMFRGHFGRCDVCGKLNELYHLSKRPELICCFTSQDLIIHVQDVSHPNIVEQRKFVEHTLKELTFAPNEDNSHLLQNIIHVGNKCDLVGNLDEIAEMYDESNDANVTGEKMHFVSSTQKFGMKRLVEAIERNILHVTNRKKMIIRVPQGGQELPWLYKNATVTHTESDSKSCDYVLAHVLVTDLMVIQFKNTFLSRK